MIIQHWQCSGTKQSCRFWRYCTSKTTEDQPEGAATCTVEAGGLCSVPVVSNTHDLQSTDIRSQSLSLFCQQPASISTTAVWFLVMDVILYVFLLGRFTQSLCHLFIIYKVTSEKEKCAMWGYYEYWRVLHKWLKKKQNISWTQSHDIKYHAQMQQQAERHEL